MNTITEQLVQNQNVENDRPLKIGIQGIAGAFHDIAAQRYFSDRPIEVVPAQTFPELVEELTLNKAYDLGIMAIENTLGGSLVFNYQLLNESEVTIIGELYLRIKQNLMALPGQRIEDLVEVRSHPMAIAQCRAFFRQLPHIKLVETSDTALSAKEIRDNQLKGIGAIASTRAAELYDLALLGESIETNKKNHTRFLILSPDLNYETKVEKVSICFAVANKVGSLHQLLGVLAAYEANLTKIQSRPIIGEPWEYLFFVDFVIEGEIGWKYALDAIRPLTSYLKVLGVYSRGLNF